MDSKKVIVIALIAVALVAVIGMGAYLLFFYATPDEKIEEVNPVTGQTELISKNTKYEELRNNFNTSFTNTVRRTTTLATEPDRADSSKDIVYTKYELELFSDGKYDININIPYINLEGEEVEKINDEINEIFGSKVNSIIQSKDMLSVYSVDYVAYLNEDMLSIVIKATLKENDYPQRVIVKTYNYNFARQEQVKLGALLTRNNLSRDDVQKKINETIGEISQINSGLEQYGYSVFKRDLSNSMYAIENIDAYFIDQNNYLYLVLAYGNKNYTSEIDLIIF